MYDSRQHLITAGDPVERAIRQFSDALDDVEVEEILPSIKDFIEYLVEYMADSNDR